MPYSDTYSDIYSGDAADATGSASAVRTRTSALSAIRADVGVATATRTRKSSASATRADLASASSARGRLASVASSRSDVASAVRVRSRISSVSTGLTANAFAAVVRSRTASVVGLVASSAAAASTRSRTTQVAAASSSSAGTSGLRTRTATSAATSAAPIVLGQVSQTRSRSVVTAASTTAPVVTASGSRVRVRTAAVGASVFTPGNGGGSGELTLTVNPAPRAWSAVATSDNRSDAGFTYWVGSREHLVLDVKRGTVSHPAYQTAVLPYGKPYAESDWVDAVTFDGHTGVWLENVGAGVYRVFVRVLTPDERAVVTAALIDVRNR